MKNKEFPRHIITLTIIIVLAFFIIKSQLSLGAVYGPNYQNVSVDTTVNISDSQPEVLSVLITQSNVTLNAGRTRGVVCNVSVQDYNGWNDTIAVNATFWDNNVANSSSIDDNNTHYTNTTCNRTGNDGQYISYWQCGFNVQYYANNGTQWYCNATAIDSYYATDSNFSDSNFNITEIAPLYALNVTSLIDYGNMAVEDTSATSETANITNFGNMDINVSVYGWGGRNLSDPAGDGLAFICEQGNITVGNERFSLTDQAWSSMTNLTSTASLINTLTMPQQTNDSQQIINVTYWRLYIPPNPFGQCNGTVVFEAQVP